MSFSFAKGTVQWLTTDALNATFTCTCTDQNGFTFQPKAIRFYFNGLQNAGDALSETVSSRRGIGFAASTSSRRCATSYEQDGADPSNCASVVVNDAVVVQLNGAAISGHLDLNTITSTGFTLIVDEVAIVNLTVFWEAWGGDEITNVTVGDIAEPASTGNVDYTATGFVAASGVPDQVVMLAGVQSTAAVNTPQSESSGFYAGFATGASNNIVCTGAADHSSATADTDGFCSSDACVAQVTLAGGNLSAKASLTQFGTNNFRLNWSARGTTDRRSAYMAIKGGWWQAGSYTIAGNSLNATASVIAANGFDIAGACFISRMTAVQTGTTTSANDRFSMGSAYSAQRSAIGHLSEDGTAAAEVDLTIQYDQCLAFISSAAALITAYDISSTWLTTTLTVINDLAGGVASEWGGYLMFGPRTPGTSASFFTASAAPKLDANATFGFTVSGAPPTFGTATFSFTGTGVSNADAVATGTCSFSMTATGLLAPVTTKFMEAGSSATGAFDFYSSTSGTITSDSGTTRGGNPRSIKLNTGSPAAVVRAVKDSILADAGRRISVWWNFPDATPPATLSGFMSAQNSSGSGLIQTSLGTDGKLILIAVGATTATGTTVLQDGVWYRISLCYTITSSTVWSARLYLNGVLEASLDSTGTLSQTLPSARLTIVLQAATGDNFVAYFSDVYVDDGTMLNDPGNVSITNKLPASNSTNQFDTFIGANPANRWTNVNEFPVSTVNGWQQAASTQVVEVYGIEAQATGYRNLDASTILAKSPWIYAKGAAGALGTPAIMLDGGATAVTLTNAAKLHASLADGSTWPTSIGMRSTGVADDTFLYDTGALIAYIPYDGSTTFTFTATGTSLADKVGVGASAFEFTAVGASLADKVGVGTVTFELTAAGVGAADITGAGASEFTFTATGIGAADGVGVGTCTFSFEATGVPPEGASTGASAFEFTATGASLADATTTGAATFEFSADAAPSVSGTVEFSFSAAASPVVAGASEFSFDASGIGASDAVSVGEVLFSFDASGEVTAPVGTSSFSFEVVGASETKSSGAATFEFAASASSLADAVATGTSSFSMAATGLLTPVTVKFMEAGSSATGAFDFYTSTSGTVTSDSGTTRGGNPRSIKLNTGSPAAAASATKNGILADAGRRISMWVNFPALPGFNKFAQILAVQDVSGNPIMLATLRSDGKFQINSVGTPVVGTTAIQAGTWNRLSLTYVITNTSTWDIRLYLNGRLEASVSSTGFITTASDRLNISLQSALGDNFVAYFSDVYVDDCTTLGDPGNISVTNKLPASNATNQFDTAVGANPTDRWTNVNEFPVSIVNGWQQAASTQVVEVYGIEAQAVGYANLDAALIVAKSPWIYAKGAAGGTGTPAVMLDGNATVITLTSAAKLFNIYDTGATWPTTIGMRSTGDADDSFLYDTGSLVAYILYVGSSPFTFTASGVSLADKVGRGTSTFSLTAAAGGAASAIAIGTSTFLLGASAQALTRGGAEFTFQVGAAALTRGAAEFGFASAGFATGDVGVGTCLFSFTASGISSIVASGTALFSFEARGESVPVPPPANRLGGGGGGLPVHGRFIQIGPLMSIYEQILYEDALILNNFDFVKTAMEWEDRWV